MEEGSKTVVNVLGGDTTLNYANPMMGLGAPGLSLGYTPGLGIPGIGLGRAGLNPLVGGIAGGLISGIGMPSMGMGIPGVNTTTSPIIWPTRSSSTNTSTRGGYEGGPLARALMTPFGIFSALVGHDGARDAAMNGDLGGWLVNTQDHTSHSHPLGGDSNNGNRAPLAFLGTLGQEVGNLLGLDQLFGSSRDYDKRMGTNYARGGGQPTHFYDGLLGRNVSSGGGGGGHNH